VKITEADACPEMLTSVGTPYFSELEILVRSTGETSTNNFSGIDTQMICVIQFYMFDSINDLIQVAHVLTSAYCECVRKQLMDEIGTSQIQVLDRDRNKFDIILALAMFTGQFTDHNKVIGDDLFIVIEEHRSDVN
jgi:hypothetical protein